MAVDKTQKDSDISSKSHEMSYPMFPMITESATSSRRGGRKGRKVWRRPIKVSRLPSFGFSGSDYTFDQIPAIFSGYTAGSEDSSSSEMSDASRSYSQSVSSADEELSHVRSRAVWKRAKSNSRIPSMKLRRQLTRKSSRGIQTRQKLKKVRSVKLSSVRNLGLKDDRNSSVGLLSVPHYLKPTSSSASKNVGKIQKNLKPNLGATGKKFSGGLTRTRSLRYSGLLKATCSSALKDSKIGNDVSDGKVCRYMYCSLHGHHSHTDNGNVPSLKRFVSMRRRLLKRQKSTSRRLILLKRSLSKKRRSAIGVDQESGQVNLISDGESCQEQISGSEIYENDVESNSTRPFETGEISLTDVDGCISLEIGIGTEQTEHVGEELKHETMDESNCRTEVDMSKNVKMWRMIYDQIVTGLSHESEETAEDSTKLRRECSGSFKDGSGVMEDEEESEDVRGIKNDKSNAVKLVKRALDEILSEIPDYSSDDKSITGDKGEDDRGLDMRGTSSDSKTHIMEQQDTDVSEINRRGPKNWSYVKKVILLKRFFKSLENVRKFDQREPREETETMRLRRERLGEKKNAEEWMLDYALRRVISTLGRSQKRKVKLLVQAFESLIPMGDGFTAVSHLKTMSLDHNDEATENVSCEDHMVKRLNSKTSDEAIKSLEDESLYEEELDGSGSSKEESETKAEKQNLIKWRNLICKHMVTGLTVNNESKHHVRRQEQFEIDKRSNGDDDDDDDDSDSTSRAVKLIQQALEKILSEIPDRSSNEETISTSSNSNSWNNLKKVIHVKRFVKSLENLRKINNRRKVRYLPTESEFEAEKVILRQLSTEHRNDADQLMLDYALQQAISRLDPLHRRKVALLVHAFDSVLDGNENAVHLNDDRTSRDSSISMQSRLDDTFRNKGETGNEGSGISMIRHKPNPKKDCDLNVDERSITADLMQRESKSSSTSIRDVKMRITVEGEKDTKLWNLIYKHMAAGPLTRTDRVDQDECHDEGGLRIDIKSSGTVMLVREMLEKILCEIPDHSSDDQETVESHLELREELASSASMAAVTTKVHSDEKNLKQRLRSEKSVKGWSNVKKVILLRRFVKELGTVTKLSPRTRTLPLESDQEAEKINLKHQPLKGKKGSEEWMLDYALRQVISTLEPSQKRKVSLLAQAFDTISFSSCSSPTSFRLSRQSSTSSLIQSENDAYSGAINEQAKCGSGYGKKEVPDDSILRGIDEKGTGSYYLENDGEKSTEELIHRQEEGESAVNVTPGNSLEKQQCSSLWRLLCTQMESGVADNKRNRSILEETNKEEEKTDDVGLENHNTDSENMELYQTEAVKLLEEVIDGISLSDNESDDSRDNHMGNTISNTNHLEERKTENEASSHQDSKARPKTKTEQMPQVRNGWSNLKRVILLKRFVKALEKVRKFNPKEPRFLPLNRDPEAEKVNLRHQETENKKNGEEWMVDYALQDVVAKLTPARKRKVQLLVQAFETVSSTGN